ncbi:phage holin family protein [Leisingera aquaemixtae]|uniref:phage holin family protein n=1 Tax=Leisingera aquaemixtae TaxID=1396826 RepID=UPI0021A40F61|nr:phage holin family protein [Leisingera aquaemixtae]UWQ24204.1 phage holin family protein [Leisingera aquaemixtae]
MTQTNPGPGGSPNAASIVSEALNNISSLIRNELALARAEVGENMNRAAVALGLIVGGVVVALTALNVLAAALSAGLTEAGMDPGWAALLVGVAFAAIAFGMIAKGTSDLKLSSLAPTRTAENVKRDAQSIKETYNDK